MASAAAVASSNNDALAISIPVKSIIMVWKFKSASNRPCAISAWYGVYAVYHPGFSRTFLKITGGTMVSLYPNPIYDLKTSFLLPSA